MHKTSPNRSGFLIPRLALAAFLFSAAVFLAFLSFAGNPARETPQGPPAQDAPRYQNYVPPLGLGASAGEPSIGVNPFTGKVFFIANIQTLRVSFDDCSSPAKDLWEDVTPPESLGVTLDPILFTDQETERTFSSQLLGKTSELFFTDDDGATWERSQGSGINSGVDHQTIGGGPFAPGLSGVGYQNATYYCSQDAALAQCALSLDGGMTFGPAVPIYTLAQCAGIHGHVKVAPDGTVYVPNKSCGGKQGVAVSEDNGVTWAIRTIPGSVSVSGIIDPSLGIGVDGTIYLAYRQGGTGPQAGHPKVAISRDKGRIWENDQDIGAAFGLQNVTFPEAVAGDSDRAAVAFLGTPTGGNYQAPLTTAGGAGFKGEWHLYIAHTYDRGVTWTMVDATPTDPVQRNSICNSGTTCTNTPNDRNLLDFNDMTIDAEGRALVAYADGCITPRCIQGLDVNADGFKDNDYSSRAAIARQSGGRPLYAAFDPNPAEPAAPKAPKVKAIETPTGDADLSWPEPDNGGSPITGYNVYRRTSTGTYPLTPLVTLPSTTRSYLDSTGDPAEQYFYRVTAFNAIGEGPFCNEETPLPPVLPDLCFTPGIKVLIDTTGDSIDQQPSHDVHFASIAEPFATGLNRLVVTIKMADLVVLTPDTFWAVQFTAPNNVIYFAGMRTNPAGLPSFSYGTGNGRDVLNPGTPALAGSGYNPDGTITVIVPTSGVGNPLPGQSLTSFLTRIQVGLITPDNMPNDLAPSGQYTLAGNAFCGPNTEPTAVLTAMPISGDNPLNVTFDGSGSSDAEDTIASYTFRFGDGSPAVTATSPSAPMVMHTYNDPGVYRAQLQVTDSRGKVSINAAEQVITVGDPETLVPLNVVSRKTHAPDKPFDVNLPLTGTRGIECRNGGANFEHTMIFTFVNDLSSVGGASVTSGTVDSSSSAIGPNANQYTVNLTGVDNAQTITVTLTNVNDSTGNSSPSISASMDILAGDTTEDGRVNVTDSTQTKSRSGQVAEANNFRSDVNLDGRINVGDVNFVKSQSGFEPTARPRDQR